MELEHFDYVILGAGSAGCVIANRLSEDRGSRVALLDAGPDILELSNEEQGWVDRPELFQYMQDTRFDWNYWMEPQQELAGRTLYCPRGKIVGGTSTFIAGMYIRGNRNDYDDWAAMGNDGWGYDSVLPYFKRLERNLSPNVDWRYHGAEGALTITDLPLTTESTQIFLRAAEHLGYKRNSDFNGVSQDGLGRYQFYLDERGERVNSANGYLPDSVRARANLTIVSNAHVEMLMLERKDGQLVATGARYMDRTDGGRRLRDIVSRREIIVCCGAIDSPKLLMLSGVGPEKQLWRHGIRPKVPLQGVGENFQDHLVIPMGWLYQQHSPAALVAAGIEAGMFLRTDSRLRTPNLQFVFNHAILGPPGQISRTGFQIVPALVDPKSRGRVTLRSALPWAPPSIYGGFLTDPRDMAALIDGVRRGLQIVGHPLFDKIRGPKLPAAPPPDFDASKQDIERFIRQFSVTLFHPSGTCKMGPKSDRTSVVDSQLRVHGVRGLRVVDASIMPTITTGNCHTPVTMIAEKAADMIRRANPGSALRVSAATALKAPAAGTDAIAATSGFLPPGFPSGVNPETFRLEEVRDLLESAAYFPIFSVHNPSVPNRPVFSWCSPLSPVAVEVNESLHRFALQTSVSELGGRISASNCVASEVANVFIRWTVIPDDYEASPDETPPPTSLDPFRSQRFAMMDGVFRFKDEARSGFRGFGTGRTFPVATEGRGSLRIGAVVDIVEGFGALAACKGAVVINGYIEPPQQLALNMMVRIMDPVSRFRRQTSLSPLQQVAEPDRSATFLAFLGEVDPERPVKLLTGPDGQVLGSIVYEKLRLASLDFDLQSATGIRSQLNKGEIVGTLSAQLNFNPLALQCVTPISTTNGVFTFFDRQGKVTGTIHSNMVEGRALRTDMPGLPFPIFRFAGFGPILGGSGHFRGIDGMMSMNSAVSVFPRTLSNLYVFRVYDPDRKYRQGYRRASQATGA